MLYDTGFGTGLEPLETLWNLLYRKINRANTVIDRCGKRVEGVWTLTEGLKGLPKPMALRSMALFYAVQANGENSNAH